MPFYSLNDLTNVWKFNNDKKYFIKSNIYKYISKFCEVIDIEYIKRISSSSQDNKQIIFYSINSFLSKYSIKNEIIGCIIFKTILNTKEKKRIYIPLITVHKKMRSIGYGKMIMDDFIKKYKKNCQILEIVLLSLPESLKFYLDYGFSISRSKFIERNEEIENNIILSISL